MAVFTGTPIVAVPQPPGLQINQAYGHHGGPDFFGSSLWIAGAQAAGSDIRKKNTAVSLDDGLTWTHYDQTDPPTNNVSLRHTSVFDPVSGIIHFIYDSSAAANVHIIYASFNTNTLTWSAPVDSGIECNTVLQLIKWNDGSLAAVYAPRVVQTDLKYVPISASGVFGSPVTIVSTANTVTPRGIAFDEALDTAHIFYRQNTATTSLRHVSVSFSGTISADDLVISSSSFLYLLSNGKIYNDHIIIAINDDVSMRIIDGTPVAAPVWSTSADLLSGLDLSWEFLDPALDIDGDGLAQFFFSGYNFLDTSYIYRRSWNGSTVGTAEIYWDVVNNPVPGTGSVPPDDRTGEALSVSIVAGVTRLIVYTQVNNLANLSSVYISTTGSGAQSGYENTGKLAWH